MLSFRSIRAAVIIMLAAAAAGFAAPVVRIKDIATIEGVRANQVLGMGLVTGLNGQGDSSSAPLLRSTISALVSSFGVTLAPQDVRSRNAAVVMVSADLPPFSRSGDRIDVTISSIGDARNLEGGVLLQTNLQAANGQVYAVAQGKVTTSLDPAASRTVGTVAEGGIVERDVVSQFQSNNTVSIVLRNPDFVTAAAVQKAISTAFNGITVTSRDPSLIDVQIPQDRWTDPVGFLAQLEALTVTPDSVGKVVIDSQSGVIVMGEKVRIGKVAVSYRTTRVTVGAAATGAANTPDVLTLGGDTTTVDDFVSALKGAGLKVDTVIGILEAVEKAGALFGTLVVM